MPKDKDLREQVPAGAEKPKKRPHPNEGIDLSPFTYSGKFDGARWEEYNELVHGKFEEDDYGNKSQVSAGLNQTDAYEFEAYKANQLRKRLFPKSKTDTTTILNGISIVQEKPVRSTVNTLARINILNSQIENSNEAVPMLYWLLKKIPTNA